MISVELRERPRVLELYVGEKEVGRVTVYRPGGHTCETFHPGEEKRYRYLQTSVRTIEQAARAILDAQDYGRRATVTVKRRALGNVR